MKDLIKMEYNDNQYIYTFPPDLGRLIEENWNYCNRKYFGHISLDDKLFKYDKETYKLYINENYNRVDTLSLEEDYLTLCLYRKEIFYGIQKRAMERLKIREDYDKKTKKVSYEFPTNITDFLNYKAVIKCFPVNYELSFLTISEDKKMTKLTINYEDMYQVNFIELERLYNFYLEVSE